MLRHQVRPKASFVLSEEEIGMLLRELQLLVSQHLQEADPEGISAQEKFETKLARVLGPKFMDNAKLIITSPGSELVDQDQIKFFNENFVFFPNPEEARTHLMESDPEKK